MKTFPIDDDEDDSQPQQTVLFPMKKLVLRNRRNHTDFDFLLTDFFHQILMNRLSSSTVYTISISGYRWVEHDPMKILESVRVCMAKALDKATVERLNINNGLKVIGLTNQRETTIFWSKSSGVPLYNAIVCMDNRTTDICSHWFYSNWVFNTVGLQLYALTILLTLSVVSLWFAASIVGAIDSIPIFPKLMEVIGLAYTVWFNTRYLLFKKNRDELVMKIDEIKQQVLGSIDE